MIAPTEITWSERKLEPYGRLSALQYEALWRLNQARDEYGPLLIPMDDVHHKTLRAMSRKDLIVRSVGLDGRLRFKITSRGRSALHLFGLPLIEYHKDRNCESQARS